MRIIFYCFVLILAVLIGLLIGIDPGYALLTFHHWSIEMPLWLFLILFVLLLCLMHMIFGLSTTVRYWRFRWSARKRWGRIEKSYQMLSKGILFTMTGEWKLAEKWLQRSAALIKKPFIHQLALAYVADQQHDRENSERYLQNAYHIAPDKQSTVWLWQARLLLADREPTEALPILKKLYQQSPKNSMALLLLYHALKDEGSFELALSYLPRLLKTKVLKESAYQQEEKELYLKILKAHDHDLEKLKNLWKLIPKKLHEDEAILLQYTTELYLNGAADVAAELIDHYLACHASDALSKLYQKLVRIR